MEFGTYQAHWKDLAEYCDRDCRPYFTEFVPREDFYIARSIAEKAGVSCTMWGGTADTERVMLCFAPLDFPVRAKRFPLCCLTFSYHVPKPPEHRAFLGTFMACNLKRDTIGDILIAEKMAQTFVTVPAAGVILQEVCRIGHVGVNVTKDTPVSLTVKTAFSSKNGTVASLRADALTAFVTRLSREKAVQLIRQGKLSCRHTTIDAPAAQMQLGDVFSIRGYGKFRIAAIDGMTRKGRYHITIQKYQ